MHQAEHIDYSHVHRAVMFSMILLFFKYTLLIHISLIKEERRGGEGGCLQMNV